MSCRRHRSFLADHDADPVPIKLTPSFGRLRHHRGRSEYALLSCWSCNSPRDHVRHGHVREREMFRLFNGHESPSGFRELLVDALLSFVAVLLAAVSLSNAS